MKKNLKKGMVKRIEREELVIIILGPINKDSGNHMEKKVSLHCVKPTEGFEAEVFEFMRDKIVGKEIEFNDYDLGGRTAADVFVNGQNLAYLLARNGLVDYFQNGQKTSNYYQDIVEGDKEAEKDKKGKYFEEEIEKDGKKKKKKKQKLPTLESLIGTEINAWIEEVNYKLDFKMYVKELDDYVDCVFLGVMIPVVGKEHMQSFRNFCSKNVLQRLRKFKLKQSPNADGVLVYSLVELHVSEDESLMKKLFTNAFCKLEKEAQTKLDLTELLSLRSLQDQGINSGKGIWKDYKGKLPISDPKKSESASEFAKLLQNPEFEAVVVAVHSGDTLTIETESGIQYRVNFTNLKAKTMGNHTKNEDPLPWAFEAKEMLRKKIIGKKVKVKVDNVRNVVTEERTFDVINVTLFYENSPVALELVEKGLVSLVPPKFTETSSSALVLYSEAFSKAQIGRKGLHSDLNPIRKYWDLSKPELRKKAKNEMSLENYKDLNEGVVENVISPVRFKVRFDEQNCYFILSLNSVKGVPNNVNNKTEEKWANEALDFAKKAATQRDVKFLIEQVDKNGVAHGSLFIGKENFALNLLKRGLVYVESSFKSSKFVSEYEAAEVTAKSTKKGIWGDSELNLDKVRQNEEEDNEEESEEIKTVALSEFFSARDFFLQDFASESFQRVNKSLKKIGSSGVQLKEPILIGTIAVGPCDGELNRCKIIKKRKDDYEVEYIDYGNTGYLKLNELKQCPNDIQKVPAQAFNARLDYIFVPPEGTSHIGKVNKYMEKLGANAKLKCRVTRRANGFTYCVLWTANTDTDLKKSLNYAIVKEGFAVVENGVKESVAKIFEVAGQIGSDKNPELISFMNNMDD